MQLAGSKLVDINDSADASESSLEPEYWPLRMSLDASISSGPITKANKCFVRVFVDKPLDQLVHRFLTINLGRKGFLFGFSLGFYPPLR